MKWTKRNQLGAGALGQGYESGEYVIEETYKSYELQKQYGGKKSDYYWMLKRGFKYKMQDSNAKRVDSKINVGLKM